MITVDKVILSFNANFLINVGIIICLNLMYIVAFVHRELTTMEFFFVMMTNVILMIMSLILHEFGHMIGASLFSVTIRKIILSSCGGLIQFNKDAQGNDLKGVILSLILGPLLSIVIGVLLLSFWYYHLQYDLGIFPIKETIENSLLLIGGYNLFIGFINLIPANPFDGGRIINFFLKERCKSEISKIELALHYWNKLFYILSMIFVLYLIINYLQFTLLVLLVYLILLFYDSKYIEIYK